MIGARFAGNSSHDLPGFTTGSFQVTTAVTAAHLTTARCLRLCEDHLRLYILIRAHSPTSAAGIGEIRRQGLNS